MMGELVPILAIICTIGLPIIAGLILGVQWIKSRHTERIGLIQQGIIPPDSPKKKSDPNRLVSLRNGIVLIALGGGIIVGILCFKNLAIGKGNEFWLMGASIVFFLGVGYLAYLLVAQKVTMPRPKEEVIQE